MGLVKKKLSSNIVLHVPKSMDPTIVGLDNVDAVLWNVQSVWLGPKWRSSLSILENKCQHYRLHSCAASFSWCFFANSTTNLFPKTSNWWRRDKAYSTKYITENITTKYPANERKDKAYSWAQKRIYQHKTQADGDEFLYQRHISQLIILYTLLRKKNKTIYSC